MARCAPQKNQIGRVARRAGAQGSVDTLTRVVGKGLSKVTCEEVRDQALRMSWEGDF